MFGKKKKEQPEEMRGQKAKAKVKAAAQSVKNAAGNAAGKVKVKVNKVTQTVKMKVKDYNEALQAAHDEGFQNGWDAHDKLPKVPGARAAATVGYNKGIKARARNTKAQKHLSGASAARSKKQTAKG